MQYGTDRSTHSPERSGVELAALLQRLPLDWSTLLQQPQIQALCALILEEDIGTGDITAQAAVPAQTRCQALFVARQPTMCCGVPLAIQLIARVMATKNPAPHSSMEVIACAQEGQPLQPGEILLAVQGQAQALLTAERAVLNALMRLCGIAYMAHTWCALLAQYPHVRLCATRKTVPGWRLLDKAAVCTGGAWPHRLRLDDAVLIKDNHILAAGGLLAAIERARAAAPAHLRFQVEVDDLAGLRACLAQGVTHVLLDNFSCAQLKEAVLLNAGRAHLEASGGITQDNVCAVASTGVDSISVGALTHSVISPDLGCDFQFDAIQ